MYPIHPPHQIGSEVSGCCNLPIAVDVLAHLIHETEDLLVRRRPVGTTLKLYFAVTKKSRTAIDLIHREALKFLEQIWCDATVWIPIRSRMYDKFRLNDAIAALLRTLSSRSLYARPLGTN